MAIKMPKDPNKVKTLCYKYQKQLKELTQKCEKESLKWGMEEYYLTQKIRDFEALCKQNNVDFTIVNERDAKRRQS
jgi:hypothetical protein